MARDLLLISWLAMQLPTTNACVAWKQYLSMFCTYESQRFFFLKEVRFFRLVCQPINQPYFSLTPNQHQSLTSQYYFSLITNHHQPPIITKRTERTLYKIVKCMQMQRRRKKTDPPCLVCSRAPLTGDRRGPVLSAGNDRFWTRIILHWHVQ